jgi:hypothetical protein
MAKTFKQMVETIWVASNELDGLFDRSVDVLFKHQEPEERH